MKISEVIKELKKATELHGDIDCVFLKTADSAGKKIYMHDLIGWELVKDEAAGDYISIILY